MFLTISNDQNIYFLIIKNKSLFIYCFTLFDDGL